jgi:hypothetical protein
MCNATIPKGDECVAQSFGLDSQPYQPWEHEFLGEEPEKIDGTIRVSSTKVEEFEPKGEPK